MAKKIKLKKHEKLALDLTEILSKGSLEILNAKQIEEVGRKPSEKDRVFVRFTRDKVPVIFIVEDILDFVREFKIAYPQQF